MATMTEPTARLAFSAGALIRGQVRRQIKLAAVGYGVELDFDEDKGLLESAFVVQVRGERAAEFATAVHDYIEKVGG